jgi:two-component system sensor histidine kinase RegB
LGTPLGTIAVVARELERDIPPENPWAEDVRLLRSQAERCREILSRLSQQDTAEETVAQRLPLSALIDEIAEPHRGFGIEIEVRANTPGALTVMRAPEVVHGLGNLIENAVDFAKTKVTIDATWDGERVNLTISDDGTGFDTGILARLGEPYVTSRATPVAETSAGGISNAHADGHAGLGLGFLSELINARAVVTFGNRPGGAGVRVTFP